MTLVKRIITAIVLFVFFFVVIYFAICMIGGAISGAAAGADHRDQQEAMEAGRQAGAAFVRHHLGTIALSSFALAGMLSLGLSFSGILPWCRKPADPVA